MNQKRTIPIVNCPDLKMNSSAFFFVFAFLTVLMPSTASAQIGSCSTGLAEADLSAGNVRARIVNTGGQFWRGSPNRYQIPKNGNANAIFTSGIWLGGLVNSTLRVAGTRYAAWEFWPGPVSKAISTEGCEPYDRVYHIFKRDMAALDAGDPPSQDVLDWPWEFGAPVIDGDGNPDNYDLAGGDRPELLGEESIFWIMNDVGNIHASTGSRPLGVEVHVTAFAAGSTNPDIDNTTFYRYRIYNRNSLPYESLMMGIFSDSDLGNFGDDYVGSDSSLNLAYTYNADNDDEGSGGYGIAPPAVGYQILGGSVVDSDGRDNDNDGEVDEAGEQVGLYSFMFWNSGGGLLGEPRTGEDLYNYMQATWRDGLPVTFGGDGRNLSSIPTSFMFSADPGEYWSESNTDGLGTATFPADRRFSTGIGPMDINPGEYKEVFFAVIWARGTDNIDSVSELKALAGRLDGLTPQDITGDTPAGFVDAPQPMVPGDMASGQPIDLTLEWNTSAGPGYEFEIQLADNDGFVNPVTLFSSQTSLALTGSVLANTDYVWRVRAFNTAAVSAWSGAFSFSTGSQSFVNLSVFEAFSVVANAAGPLDPPDMAAFAFTSSGFPQIPCPLNQAVLCDRPTLDYQQSTNSSLWGIHTLGDGTRQSYASFLERVLRNGAIAPLPFDYEIRFTGTSLHYDAFQTGTVVVSDSLPFEVWNIGIDTPIDTNDDYRMIVVGLDLGNDGWGLQDLDHEISGGSNDPQTDPIYFYKPTNTSAGTVGYDTWAAGALGDPTVNIGNEVLARIVLVNWNGGNVFNEPPTYNAALPEPGTIFRIETSLFPAPLLASPSNNELVAPGDISFFWNTVTPGSDRLIVATDVAMTILVADLSAVSSGQLVSLPAGSYYWQVIGDDGGSSTVDSEIWSLTVLNQVPYNLSVESGWNLVGIPFSASDMSSLGLFGPSVAASIRTYEERYIRPVFDLIQNGRGYWAEFPASDNLAYSVFSRTVVNIEFRPGWNLVSGPDCSIDLGDATGDTGLIASGTQSGHNSGGYFSTSTFDSGAGYWIFGDSGGTLSLDCDAIIPGKRSHSDLDLLAEFNSFKLTPLNGNTRSYYFSGDLPDELSSNAFSIPPMAPGQTWRGAFADGRYVSEADIEAVDLHGALMPLVVERGNIKPEDGLKVILRDGNGVIVVESVLTDGMSFEVIHPEAESMEISLAEGVATDTEAAELPEQFELDQNYPNPFNPSTTIRFALPANDNVSIVVLDLTGRVVARPLHQSAMVAGWHEIRFDARELASGMYFYRVSTKTEVKTRSMVLLK